MKVSKISAEVLEAKREWFSTNGVSISSWARENNVELKILYAVLNGKNRGYRGEGHRVAVRLGLKPSTSEPLATVLAPAQGGLTGHTLDHSQ